MLRGEPLVRELSFSGARANAAQLETVSRSRVFFAHQSVGQNLLDAVPSVYAASNLAAPNLINDAAEVSTPHGFILDEVIGTNGDPLGKLAAFDRKLRSGLGETLDVAMVKLCYMDFDAQTDVNAIFDSYKQTMAGLAHDYPRVRFVYTTVPLMADRDLIGRLKALFGRAQEFDPAHNAARERYNALIRAEFGTTGRLFDIAAVEAAGDGNTLRFRSSAGGEFLAMDPALSSDGGHLNSDGAVLVASNWLSVVATAAPTR